MELLHRVTEFSEFVELLPKLLRLRASMPDYWMQGHSQQDFLNELNIYFRQENWLYVGYDDNKELTDVYFVINRFPTAFFWLAWRDAKTSKHNTMECLKSFSALHLKPNGFTKWELQTTRPGPAYHRWITKHGAKLIYSTYGGTV